jgi:Xaa-Pro aminopeptidase
VIPIAATKARRARLAERMGEGLAIVPTAPERTRNRDSHYPYRYDSYFYYLTGFPEPQALLAVIAGREPRSILFCRTKNEEREIWDGFRFGPDGAKEAFAFDECFPFEALDEEIPKLIADQTRLFFTLGADADWDLKVSHWLNAVRAKSRTGVRAPSEIVDLRVLLDEMRLYKDAQELSTMRRAAEISAAAHRRAMRFARPGQREYEIEAEILHEFVRNGAQSPAYTSIVAAGANACVLHYISNRDLIRETDLILIDAGCELDGYAADITRSFPAGGKFYGERRAIYELVLHAQVQAIDAVRPGSSFIAAHDAAVRALVQGLVDLRLLDGDIDGIIESGGYKRFYMHRTGHWLGLDVHDAGEYRSEGKWKPLAPGMVLTAEPGLYIRSAADVPENFWNIGVRIEDDALVTEQGCEILTAGAPKRVADVEALMAAR